MNELRFGLARGRYPVLGLGQPIGAALAELSKLSTTALLCTRDYLPQSQRGEPFSIERPFEFIARDRLRSPVSRSALESRNPHTFCRDFSQIGVAIIEPSDEDTPPLGTLVAVDRPGIAKEP
jgi:hypothetical protein